jgi:hypothetical protein
MPALRFFAIITILVPKPGDFPAARPASNVGE